MPGEIITGFTIKSPPRIAPREMNFGGFFSSRQEAKDYVSGVYQKGGESLAETWRRLRSDGWCCVEVIADIHNIREIE